MIKVAASGRNSYDYFGTSVAISGNYAIVGAPDEDEDAADANTLSEAGSAYIFELSDGSWTLMQKIVASDRASGEYFGLDVDIDGNYAIVGAYYGGDLNGAAYIFELSGGTWSQQQKLVASDGDFDDRFGYSVAISGNYAVVGAYRETEDAADANTLSDAGSAYVFELSGGTWSQQQKLVASDRAADDEFGYNVSISGNYIFVGAYDEDEDAAGANTLSSAGSVYVFELSGGTWSQLQKLVASDRASSDNFGKTVDVNGNYAIVGAHLEDQDADGLNTLSSAGSAYVFELSGGTWTQQQKLVASDRTGSDQFGTSVAISDYYAIVGASLEDEDADGANTISGTGSTYIFERSGSSWSQQQKIVASDRAINDRFGNSIAIDGNFCIVGAYYEDEDASGLNTETRAGSAYLFSQAMLWAGSTSTDWNDASNWSSNSVPTSSDVVEIQSDPSNQPHVTLDPATPAECANLTITSGATLTIDAGKALTVNGNLDNEGTILIEADATGIGSFIDNGTITGSGSFQMEQYLTGSGGGSSPDGLFYYVSSPIPDATAATYGIPSNKLWVADETNQSYPQFTFFGIPLAVTQGYVARMGSTGVITFDGSSFNTGDLSASGLTRTGTTELNRGYNLVGNPYPSTVDWDDLGRTNLETTMWYRTHNGSTMLFDTYNATGMVGTNNNGGGTVDGTIPPTQAFWVRVDADGNTGQLDFENADRSHGTLAGIYKTEPQEGLVRLALSNGTVSDEAIVMFDASAQDNFDDYDSHKYWAANIPQLYMNLAEDTIAINGLNSTATNPTVPLGVKIPAQGNYTLNASSITFTETPVHLEDTYLNIFQDLNAEPSYAFTSDAGNINDRFILHFSAITGVDEAESNILIYSSSNQIYINQTESSPASVTVLDLSGRTILTENINSQNATVQLNAPMGIYLVRVETADQNTTKKLTIR